MKNQDNSEQRPNLSNRASELVDLLSLEPVKIDGVWHFRFKVIPKPIIHAPIEDTLAFFDEPMPHEEAVLLIRQALIRIESPAPNISGMGMQAGGAYWRLAKVLRTYLEPVLEHYEGAEHAKFIINTHGRVVIPVGGTSDRLP